MILYLAPNACLIILRSIEDWHPVQCMQAQFKNAPHRSLDREVQAAMDAHSCQGPAGMLSNCTAPLKGTLTVELAHAGSTMQQGTHWALETYLTRRVAVRLYLPASGVMLTKLRCAMALHQR